MVKPTESKNTQTQSQEEMSREFWRIFNTTPRRYTVTLWHDDETAYEYQGQTEFTDRQTAEEAFNAAVEEHISNTNMGITLENDWATILRCHNCNEAGIIGPDEDESENTQSQEDMSEDEEWCECCWCGKDLTTEQSVIVDGECICIECNGQRE